MGLYEESKWLDRLRKMKVRKFMGFGGILEFLLKSWVVWA